MYDRVRVRVRVFGWLDGWVGRRYRQLEEKDRDLMMAAQFGKQLLDAKEELEEQQVSAGHESFD